MKIAIPTQDNLVDNHFGHCEYFTVYTLEDNKKIIEELIIPSPVGCGCKSNIAETLSQMGVKMMLAGTMGEGALNVLNAEGISVIRGCTGNVKTVAMKWIDGELADSGNGCSAHEHECS